MTEPNEEQPSPPLQPVRRDNARVGAMTGAALALVAGAAITFAAAPSQGGPGTAAAPIAQHADASASPGATSAPAATHEPAASAKPGESTKPGHKGKGGGKGERGWGRGGPGFPGRGGFLGGFPGRGGFPGGLPGGPDKGIRGEHFGGITVTAIGGSNLSLKTDDGWTRTIAVGSGTKLTKGGQTITLADIAVGDTMHFAETRNDDGTYTITAIAILLPTVGGEVTAKTESTITLKQRDGTTVTVNIDADTKYHVRDKHAATLADIEVGQFIVAHGEKNDDGSLNASNVIAGHLDGHRDHDGHHGHHGAPDQPNATEPPAG